MGDAAVLIGDGDRKELSWLTRDRGGVDGAVVLIGDAGRDGRPAPRFLLGRAVGLVFVLGDALVGRVDARVP